MSSTRDKKQAEVLDIYFKANPQRCTLVLSTSFGKSKVAIDIIKRMNPPKVLILANSVDLRDSVWRFEFLSWGMKEYYENNVETATYQKATKWRPDKKDIPPSTLIIADEVDFAGGTEEMSKFFSRYPENKVVGLTGFITEAKKIWFGFNMPVLYEYSAELAQEEGVLNHIKFTFVKFNISRDPKSNTVKYGSGKSFTQSENDSYRYAEKKYLEAAANRAKLENFMATEGGLSMEEYIRKKRALTHAVNRAAKVRRELLVDMDSTAAVARKIVEYIHSTPNKKTIVFSKRVAQSVKACGIKNVYNKDIPKKELERRMTNFMEGASDLLGVCDKVNRGSNIPDLYNAVLETYFGSDTKAVQRFGRLMRLEADEVANAFILLPYYLEETESGTYVSEPTQQVHWARSMLRSTDVKHSSVWDYRAVKTEKPNE